MNPLLFVSGVMFILSAIYWWQQQVTAFAGNSAIRYSFTCLVSGGLHNSCPILNNSLNNDNVLASLLFYAGVLMLLYTFFFPKPPLPPASAL